MKGWETSVKTKKMSPSAWGRGLKQFKPSAHHELRASPSAWGRGLKPLLAYQKIYQDYVALRVRAWIETLYCGSEMNDRIKSPSAWGRGLKLLYPLLVILPVSRPPREGVDWNLAAFWEFTFLEVALRVRAWIETSCKYDRKESENRVALRVRAWIETDSCTKSITYSLLNRGKLVRFVILPTNGLGDICIVTL